MMPVFKLQIAGMDGSVAQFPAGGALEADVVNIFTAAIVSRGVGFFKTEKKVRKAIEDGIAEAIQTLKEDSKYAVRHGI